MVERFHRVAVPQRKRLRGGHHGLVLASDPGHHRLVYNADANTNARATELAKRNIKQSIWSRMKHELRHDMLFDDLRQVRTAVYRWVHLFYNRKRMYSALNYMSPVDFEEQYLRKHSDRAY